MFNTKGQAGSVFKILIGAVIGIAIVGIIYSIISIMSGQKEYLSEEVFSNKIKMAMKNPTGNPYIINDFSFNGAKSIAKKNLAEQTGLASNCITLKKDIGAQDNILASPSNTDAEYIHFPQDVIIDLEVFCNMGEEPCQIVCDLTVFDRGHAR